MGVLFNVLIAQGDTEASHGGPASSQAPPCSCSVAQGGLRACPAVTVHLLVVTSLVSAAWVQAGGGWPAGAGTVVAGGCG